MGPAFRVAFGLLFFASGALGLVYEVLWQRALTVVLGVGSFATGIILASWMGGLALGTALGERWAARTERPARLYGILEAVIGGCALLLPLALRAAEGLYPAVYALLDPGPVLFGLVQGLVAGFVVLVPTTLMGATFPLLIEALVPGGRDAGSRLGWLYGANVGGAFAGTLIGGFMLLPELGQSGATWVAVGGSLAVAGLAVAMDHASRGARWEDVVEEAPVIAVTPPVDGAPSLALVAVAAGFAGAASMVFEVAWTRLLALQVGASVYAFTTMLATFLMGLSLGAALAGEILRARPASAARGFLWAQAATVASVAISLQLLPLLPLAYLKVYHFVGGGGTAFGAHLCLAALAMLPSTLAIGTALPFALATAAGGATRVTRPATVIYVANTVGAVVGTLGAAFGLLPVLGVVGTALLAVGLELVALLVMGAPSWGRARGAATTVGAAALLGLLVWVTPPWDPLLMAAGLYKRVGELDGMTRENLQSYTHKNLEILYYSEGLNSAVSVGHSLKTDNTWLANNGKVDASTQGDLATQLMVAHLPLLLHDAPQRVAVIGLASGITLGAVTRHPVKEVEILELEPAIVEASHFFDAHNDRPLEDPRVHLHLGDARNRLLLEREAWDVIVSEPSNPWITGVSSLFTLEFWQLARSRLAPGGVLCQWIQLYELGPRDLQMLLRTFHAVFPEVLLFGSLSDADIMLVGSMAPLTLDRGRFEARMMQPEVEASLGRIGVKDWHDLAVWYVMGTREIEALAGEGPLNTDDNAAIEFRAPLFLGVETATENLRLLLEHRSGPEALVALAPEGVEEQLALAEAYLRRSLFGLARRAARAYVGEGGDLDVYQELMDRVDAAAADYPYVDPTEP